MLTLCIVGSTSSKYGSKIWGLRDFHLIIVKEFSQVLQRILGLLFSAKSNVYGEMGQLQLWIRTQYCNEVLEEITWRSTCLGTESFGCVQTGENILGQ